MAKNTTAVVDTSGNVVTEATGGVALADRAALPTIPLTPAWLPALQEMPTKVLRHYRDRLPRQTTVGEGVAEKRADERPLVEIVEPGFVTVGQIAVGRGVIAGMATGRAGQLFVTNPGDDSVSVLDTKTLSVTGTITGTEAPDCVGAAGGRAYVSTVRAAYDAVAVIDAATDSVIADHPVALSVRDLAVSPDGARAYLGRAGSEGADIAVIDTATGQLNSIELVAHTVDALAVSADGTRLYIGTGGDADGTLVVMDTAEQSVLGGVVIGAPIRGVAAGVQAGAGSGRVYVLSCDPQVGGRVDIVDTNASEITATVELGGAPTQLALSADGERAYVIDGADVIVLCTATHDIVDTVQVGADPSAIAESADGTSLYVADYLGRVTVLSVAPTAALLARMMAAEAIEPSRPLALEPAGV